eukprot:NODE_472_length_7027_cov_1.012413.p2 type:complete len:585 gc:universal NODE_472_length_7027_cov_1.012413:5991-4237(-)
MGHSSTLTVKSAVKRTHTLKKTRATYLESDKTHIDEKPIIKQPFQFKAKWSKIRFEWMPWVWTILHFIATMSTFIWSYYKYNGFAISNSTILNNPTTIQQRIQELGLRPTVGIAKASAAVINLQLALILIPVTRSLISIFRASILNYLIPFDHSTTAHKGISIYFITFSILHVVGHMFNYDAMVRKQDHLSYIKSLLSGYKNNFFGMTEYLWLSTTPGWSGLFCLVAAFLAFSGSMFKVRRQNFEIFFLSHHLWIVMFIFLIPHGETCFVPNVTSLPCGSGGDFKKSVLVGALFYIMDRIIMRHYVRNPSSSKIVKVVKHPSNVMELQIKPPDIIGGNLVVNKCVPGSIIMINCPSISKYQYHPFTLTTCPSMGVWSVHIRCTGDFTKKFATACGVSFSLSDDEISVDDLPELYVDGPFISECIDAIRHPISVFIGAGIGVTPFAALLRDTLTRIISGNTDVIIKKVYFFWICRDTQSFEWFIELLKEFEGYYDLIEPYIYVTRVEDPLTILLETKNDGADLVTGLPFQTFFGRPNWSSLFYEMNVTHSEEIGVFVCGPAALSNAVKKSCDPYNKMYFNDAKFE